MCHSAASLVVAAFCTTALGAEVALPSGATPLVAVTTTRRVWVASALVSA
jgi:hypothetical protein